MSIDQAYEGPAPQNTIYYQALDGLKDPAALLDAGGRVLFANRSLLEAQGCNAGSVCQRIGERPCPGCLMEAPEGMRDCAAVLAGGRVYERTVSPLRTGAAESVAVLWRDITAANEAGRLLRKQYEKMRRDIFHSRSIQFSLLPKELPKIDGYSFGSLYKPSEEMSGDIFNIIRIGRDNVAFYIADVAGHGVTAAMLTIFFSTAVRVEMRPTDMPGRVLARIHSRFQELQLEEQHYITAFLCRLEMSTGKLYWSNAGHICPPLLMDGQGKAETLEMAGLPISRWFKDQEYATSSGQLEPGGRLVLFSDGLESQWHGSRADGDLYRTVEDIMARTAPDDCLEAIWQAVGKGTDEAWIRDDTTLLRIDRLRGGESEGTI